MIQTYSHTFKFETSDWQDGSSGLCNNVVSITEEDAKKHYVNYIQYQAIDDNNILFKELNVKVDRLYYLEMANASIDNIERRKRLFTIVGKRCFGSNDNKLDCYFMDNTLEPREIYACFQKQQLDSVSQPILHEIVTHSTNKYEAYPFYCKNGYFAVLKQTNISKRKTFKKTFLVEMGKADFTKLMAYRTNSLKIDFIFNLIGKIHFTYQPLEQKNCSDIEHDLQSIISKKLEKHDDSITNQSFLDEKLFSILKSRVENIEDSYFRLLSKSIEFIDEPNNDKSIFLFVTSISSYIELIKDQELFDEIVSFLEILKIIAKEKRISYLMAKNDQDIKDIFLFMLETITVWKNSLYQNDISNFNIATLDLYNTLRYFIDTYFKFYYDYQTVDAQAALSKETVEIQLHKEKLVSAQEYFNDIELDYAILDELLELEVELESYLYADTFDKTAKEASVKCLNGYTKMLNQFYEFQELAYAITLLIEQVEMFDAKHNNDIMNCFKAIVNDLIQWKRVVFIEQSAEDIYSIDDSFYLNIAQIDILLEESDEVFG